MIQFGSNLEASVSDRNRSNQFRARANRQDLHKHSLQRAPFTAFLLVICAFAMLQLSSSAQIRASEQTSPFFEVSNPKHLDWSMEEANRIYSSACELVARSIRPENPPHLAPKFVLVLGTKKDETLRIGGVAEVHLRHWDPAHFAEAMVLMAAREILKEENVIHLTRDTLAAAGATVSVSELRRNK